jgi:hypothetical protein
MVVLVQVVAVALELVVLERLGKVPMVVTAQQTVVVVVVEPVQTVLTLSIHSEVELVELGLVHQLLVLELAELVVVELVET